MESTHAALVVSAPGQLRIEQVPTRQPRAGEMLVATICASICGSDLDALRGSRPLATRILGHEGLARVVAAGSGVSGFVVGQHVTFLPNDPDNPNNTLGVDTEGLFQRYLLVSEPALARGMVLPVEHSVPFICGPLIEPFATVLYGQEVMRQVVGPERLVVAGAGPIGMLNALYAQAQGYSQIILVDTSPARLEWAARRGIVDSALALPASPDLAERILALTGGRGADAAYLCVPRAATRAALRQALRYVRADGAISLTAGLATPDPLPELPGVDLNGIRSANVRGQGQAVAACETVDGKRLWLTGHSGASARYLVEAMRLLQAGPERYARVISHIASYRAAPQVIERLLAPGDERIAGQPAVKVILNFASESEAIQTV